MSKSRDWTPEDEAILKEKWSGGERIRDIASGLGRTPKSVERKVAGLGLPERQVGPKPPKNIDQAEFWKKECKRLTKRLEDERWEKSGVEALVEQVRSVAPLSYKTAPDVKWPVKHKGSSQSAVLMFSDQHVGQEVSADQTLGFGGYGIDIFLSRLKRLEEAVYSILHDHVTTPIDELVIPMLGDTLHGNLSHAVEAGQQHTLFEQYFIASHSIAQFFRNVAALVPRVRVYTAVGNHCLDAKSEIFTDSGWKTYQQLVPGDKCLGLDPATSEVFWQEFTPVIEDRVDRMVSIENRQFSFRGTEHHRFYFRPHGCSKTLEARWSEIANIDCSIDIPVSGFVSNTGEDVPDDLIELTAAVLTDGTVGPGGVIVYQKPVKEEWVKSAFIKSGLQFSRRHRVRKSPDEICGRPFKGGETTEEVSYRLTSESGRDFLSRSQLKKGSLPKWVWNMTQGQFERFLNHLLLGDGTSIDSPSPVLYGKSAEWLGQVQGLCAMHGWKGLLSQYNPNNSNSSPQYRLSLTKQQFVSLGKSSSVSYESGTVETVWCVRTESENFLCRRDGCSYFTGNTRWGTQKKMPTDNRYSNLDSFVYATIQALTKGIDSIEWHLDKQPFALFQVQGFQFYAGHGDNLRGGDKALGIPAHAIGRNISSTMGLRARAGQPLVNYYLFGHVHKPIQIPHTLGEIITNGGFPGVDGYGLAEGFQSYPPSQKFFLMHPKFGRAASYDLRLDFEPKSPTTYDIPKIG